MKKLLYIDACIRDENSKTKRIASPIIEELKNRYDVEELVLNDLDLFIVGKDEQIKRTNGVVSDKVLSWAYKVRDADRIVIAAPFWDMSIPAALKVFIELVSLFDITFKSDNVTCYGNCNCKKLLYITTRGMNIKTGSNLDQGTSYLKALSELWGLGEVITLAKENMDYISNDEIEIKINDAIKEGIEICKDF